MRIPTLYTLNEAETAQVIGMIAKKEQTDRNRPFNPHGKRSRLSQSGAKEYILSSIPCVGPIVAGYLLRHFGSVEKVMTASQEELMKVERVGARISVSIREIAERRYEPE